MYLLISSPSTLQNDTTQEEDEDDTLSRTLSENSFMSAMSEHDDYGLVNLHMQVNKPITESPLLMTSYISHLSQYRCSYWDETVSILRTESMKANNNLFPKVRFFFQYIIYTSTEFIFINLDSFKTYFYSLICLKKA